MFATAYYNKGNGLRTLGKKCEAIEMYDKSIKIDHCKVDAYFDKGFILMELKGYNDSINCFSEAI